MENVLNNSLFKSLEEKARIVFDYEIQNISLDENDQLNSKMYYYDKVSQKNSTLHLKKESSITILIGTLLKWMKQAVKITNPLNSIKPFA